MNVKFAPMLHHAMRSSVRMLVVAGFIVSATNPAMAQDQSGTDQPDYPTRRRPQTETPDQRPGTVAQSAVGQVGQRQQGTQPVAGIKPTARINNRIANRVESRIRNRIDKTYDPQANATSPFKVAADTAQTPTRAR